MFPFCYSHSFYSIKHHVPSIWSRNTELLVCSPLDLFLINSGLISNEWLRVYDYYVRTRAFLSLNWTNNLEYYHYHRLVNRWSTIVSSILRPNSFTSTSAKSPCLELNYEQLYVIDSLWTSLCFKKCLLVSAANILSSTRNRTSRPAPINPLPSTSNILFYNLFKSLSNKLCPHFFLFPLGYGGRGLQFPIRELSQEHFNQYGPLQSCLTTPGLY